MAKRSDWIAKDGNTSLKLISESPSHTQRIGVRIGELARAGDIVLLVGGLGTGKTCLAQGIAWGLGVEEYAVSPSFVFIREYQGRLPLYHIDLYRIEGIEEVEGLGLEDYLHGKGVSVVEWAERGMSLVPREHILINMRYISYNKRSLSLMPRGERYMEMLRAIGGDWDCSSQ